MRRISLIAIVVFLALPPAAGSAEAPPARAAPEQVAVELKFRADGFLFEFSNDDGAESDVPSLTVSRNRQAVFYEGHGEITRDSIEMRFGRLDGRFHDQAHLDHAPGTNAVVPAYRA